MLQLLINDRPVDIQGDEEIAVDYAMFDIKDIGSRKGARSYNFTLPLTANNKRVFENPGSVDSLGSIVYSRLKARAYVDGLDVGIVSAEVESVSDCISLRLYGSNSGFYNLIYGKMLKDLDVADLDHMWNWDNVVNKRGKTEGIIYPIIDYSYDASVSNFDNANNKVYADKLLPAFFVHDLIRRIIKSCGYTCDNKLEDEFLAISYHLILPCHGDGFVRSSKPAQFIGKWGLSTDYVLNQQIIFDTILSTPTSYYSNQFVPDGLGGVFTGFPFYFPEPGIFTVEINLELLNLSAQDLNLTIYIVKGPGAFGSADWINVADITVPAGAGNLQAPYVAQFALTVPVNTVVGPHKYQLLPTVLQAIASVGSLVATTNSTFEITNFEPLGTADTQAYYNTVQGFIEAKNLLPDIKMSEFIKTYCQMFGLFINVDEENKKITFLKFQEILANNIWRAVDWSSKVDNSEMPVQQFILEGYAQINDCIYEDVKDEVPPAGANSALLVNNQNLELQHTYLKLPYGYTNTSSHLGRQLPHIRVIKSDDSIDSTEPRILLMQHESLSTALVYTDDDTSTTNVSAYDNVPFCWFIEDGKTVNLGFASNLLPRYYSNLQQIIANLKILVLPLRLTAADINQLDFTRPVYLSQFSSYFYINKIQGFKYTSNDSTMVELVKLNING